MDITNAFKKIYKKITQLNQHNEYILAAFKITTYFLTKLSLKLFVKYSNRIISKI